MKPRASQRPAVLFVDDEADLRELVSLTIERMGLDVTTAGSLAEAHGALSAQAFQLLLTDMRLPDGEGLQLLRYVATRYPNLPVAVITAFGNTENAVAALKAGAFDYLSKPVSVDDLRRLVQLALRVPAQADPGELARDRLLGSSAPIIQVRALIARLSRSQAPVYISGESGSGKEMAARLLHEGGARSDRPFVAVNCGAIPETLMESEFFGYRKGSFTGASEDRGGFFHAAHGGTLFLDEVADLPLAMQVKLLRVIQEKRVRKVGATSEDPVDVRILCATHQNLAALVEAGRFRQDLYYRLAVIDLRMPSLRECRDDIPLLAQSLLARMAAQHGEPMPRVSNEAITALMAYDFPGNVRELENILERAVALCGGATIQVDDLRLAGRESGAQSLSPRTMITATGSAPMPLAGSAPVQPVITGHSQWPADFLLDQEGAQSRPLPDFLEEIEREAILSALAKTGFNRTKAAQVLGITFRALRYRMERLGIKEPE